MAPSLRRHMGSEVAVCRMISIMYVVRGSMLGEGIDKIVIKKCHVSKQHHSPHSPKLDTQYINPSHLSLHTGYSLLNIPCIPMVA